MLKRLNPADIKKVYKKTGWVPAFGDCATFAYGWACPSAILLVYKKIDPSTFRDGRAIDMKCSEVYGIDPMYFAGLDSGFSEQFPWSNLEDFSNGHEDGLELLSLVRSDMRSMPDMKPGWGAGDLS